MNTITTPLSVRVLGRGIGVLLMVGAAAASAAPGATPSTERAEVSYRDPAAFAEMTRDPTRRPGWLDDLSRYVARRAARLLPDNERLLVTITDVQRAGSREPGHFGASADLLVVRDTTPPRIDLTFQLVSAQGAVLKEGSRRLRDVGFLNRSGFRPGDALAYEEKLIDTWLRDDFGPMQR